MGILCTIKVINLNFLNLQIFRNNNFILLKKGKNQVRIIIITTNKKLIILKTANRMNINNRKVDHQNFQKDNY
jgi:hypothetical protein